MADDLRFSSFWPVEQGLLYSPMHYIKTEGDDFLDNAKASLNVQVEERVQSDDPHLELDDVLMLDDIREFSMRNGFAIDAETNFHSNDKSSDTAKSLQSSFKTSSFSLLEKQSSQFATSPLKSPDEYLPNSMSDTSHSDTFQDLSIFMPQVSTTTTTRNSYTASSYSSVKSFSDDSSSSSQFTNLSFPNKTSPTIEMPSTEFKAFSAIDSSIDNNKSIKCTESKGFKQTRNRDVRKKNNLASQRSRMTRKEREREMENKEKFLEQENQMLRIKVAKLEELSEALRSQLFRSVLGR